MKNEVKKRLEWVNLWSRSRMEKRISLGTDRWADQLYAANNDYDSCGLSGC